MQKIKRFDMMKRYLILMNYTIVIIIVSF